MKPLFLCGLSAVLTLPLCAYAMINGKNVESGDYPSVGAMTVDSGVLCTGTMVTPRLMITAAHCLTSNQTSVEYGPEEIKVYFGDGGTEKLLPSKALKGTLEVEGVGIFPHYANKGLRGADNLNDASSDVGFLVLKKPVKLKGYPKVSPEEVPANGETLIGVGFGLTNMDTADKTAGKKLLGEFLFSQVEKHEAGELILSSVWDNNESLYYGDSGGPVFSGESPDDLRLLGVASLIGFDKSDGWAKLNHENLCFIQSISKISFLGGDLKCPQLRTYTGRASSSSDAYEEALEKCERENKSCTLNTMAYRDSVSGNYSAFKEVKTFFGLIDKVEAQFVGLGR